MTDADRTRALATVLGLDAETAAARADRLDESRYDALTGDAEEGDSTAPLTDVAFNPGDDEYNVFVSTFTLRGDEEGPLAGMTLGVKDNVAVAGVPLTAGAGVFADVASALRADAAGGRFGDRVVENALDGAALLEEGGASVYLRALAGSRRFAEGYLAALDGRDALLAPTMPVTAPAVGEWPLSAAERGGADAERPPLSVNVRQANPVGAPALSLPCGRVDGLPVGVQLLGSPGGDVLLLAAAAAVEAALRS